MSLNNCLQNPKYRNWVRASLGLIHVKDGLTTFVKEKLKEVHTRLINTTKEKCNIVSVKCDSCSLGKLLPGHIVTGGKCPLSGRCFCMKREKRKCPEGNSCGVFYDLIATEHTLRKPIWENTNPRKWATDPWEVAKCYLSSSHYKDKKLLTDIDASGLLSICINCKSFHSRIDQTKFEAVRNKRNEILHSSTFELEDTDFSSCIDLMLDLLNEEEILKYEDAQKAVTLLKELRDDKTNINDEMATKALDLHVRVQRLEDNSIRNTNVRDQSKAEKNMKDLQKYLVDTYQQYYLTMDVSPTIPEVCMHVNDMFVPVDMARSIVKDMNAVRNRTEYNKDARIPESTTEDITTFEEIFTAQGKPLSNIFIIADAGMGKSSLCRKILSSWCNSFCNIEPQTQEYANPNTDNVKNETFMGRSFDFVFFVSLRHAAVNEEYVEDMIKSQLLEPVHHETFHWVLETNENKCLVLLDGLDEWATGTLKRNPKSIRKTPGLPYKEYRYCTLYTTRPWKISDIHPVAGDIDVKIVLSGMNRQNEEYLANIMIQKLNNHYQKQLLLKDFYYEIQNKGLSHLTHIPVTLKLLLCQWFDNQTLPETKATLYGDMVELLLKVYTEKGIQNAPVNVDQAKLPFFLRSKPNCQKYQRALLALFHFSFETLKNADDLVFNASQLQCMMSDSDKETCLKSGLLSKSEIQRSPLDRHVQVSNIHKTFQEFYAALHISMHPACLPDLLKSRADLRQHANLITFLSGLGSSAVDTLAKHLYDTPGIGRDDPYREHDPTLIQRTILRGIKESRHSPENEVPLKDLVCKDSEYDDYEQNIKFIDPLSLKSIVVNEDVYLNDYILSMNQLEQITVNACNFSERHTPSSLVTVAQNCANTLTKLTLDMHIRSIHITHSQATTLMCLPVLTDIHLHKVQCKADIDCGCDHLGEDEIVKVRTTNVKLCYLRHTSQVLCHVSHAPNLEILRLVNYTRSSESPDRLCKIMQTCSYIQHVDIENMTLVGESCIIFPQIQQMRIIWLEGVTVSASSLKSIITNFPADHPEVYLHLWKVDVEEDDASAWLLETYNVTSGEEVWTDNGMHINKNIPHQSRIIPYRRGMWMKVFGLTETRQRIDGWFCDVYNSNEEVSVERPVVGYRDELLSVEGEDITNEMQLRDVMECFENSKAMVEETGNDFIRLRCRFRPEHFQKARCDAAILRWT